MRDEIRHAFCVCNQLCSGCTTFGLLLLHSCLAVQFFVRSNGRTFLHYFQVLGVALLLVG